MKQEYELFKDFCLNQKIERTDNNFKFIENFKAKALSFSCDSHYCYMNEPIVPLSESGIRNGLSATKNQLISPLDIVYQSESTNKDIINLKHTGEYSVLLAEYQSAGQGRRLKQWVSPLAANIYLSLKFTRTSCPNAHFIPLITALSVCNAFAYIGVDGCQIKWPNDIYLNGKKLGGVLVESRVNSQTMQRFVVGIGLNINMVANQFIDQPWTSLSSEKKMSFNRNIIISSLLSEIMDNYNQLADFNYLDFKKNWSKLDFLKNKTVQIIEENNSYEARVMGITENGALQVSAYVDEQFVKKKVYAADVSIKQPELPKNKGLK